VKIVVTASHITVTIALQPSTTGVLSHMFFSGRKQVLPKVIWEEPRR